MAQAQNQDGAAKRVMTPIRVRATRLGYYNHKRRRENDVFDLIPIKGHRRAFEDTGRKDANGRALMREVSTQVMLSPEEQLSTKWMEEVPRNTPLHESTPAGALKEHHDKVMAERAAQRTSDGGGDEVI